MYHITVSKVDDPKYPYRLNTESDQIKLTDDELAQLSLEVANALDHQFLQLEAA